LVNNGLIFGAIDYNPNIQASVMKDAEKFAKPP
jgi:hypothetical protein